MAGLYKYDHGERFEQHGFYNLLVFLAIYIPLNLVLGGLYVLWRKVDKFPAYFAVAVLVGGIYVSISLMHYRKVFDQGLRGSFDYSLDECTWSGRNVPAIDLLPAGTQNFWAGSMHCKSEPQRIDANIDENGVLTVHCETPGSNVLIDILPETREWPLRDKDIWSTCNHMVIERTQHLEYYNDIPFVLNDTTQTVVVRCGSSSTLVSRVAPSISKLPVYTPPQDSDTRTPNTTSIRVSPDILHSNRKSPNVIYLMLDAVSRRQFHRQLPHSAHILRTLHQPGVSQITELFRYHSVGFSTDNNTKAMFLGDIYPKKRNTLPIWAYFRDRGYITARVESGCEDWAKEYNGHNYPQQDFAVSNRSLDYELTAPFCLPEFYPSVGNPFGNFKGPYSIIARCLFGRYLHEWAFDYLYKLRRELRPQPAMPQKARKHRPYMITVALMEGHEGTGEVLRTLDDALAAFIKDMRDSGELDDTVLIIGGDHGLHMGLNFAYTQNGRIEHQNPFFAMSVPEWLHQFAGDYQANNNQEQAHPLALNEQRLTTPFELHHTFRVLAEWPEFSSDSWKRSLFYAQKKGRTCDEAGIGAGFCMCKTK
ncbi:hypothetical protein IWW43_001674 [Coemansia sp. RSA 1935]|nr:hypothetical protein IWW43_001674 [Coemansia sp. RSA 1935]